MANDRNHGGARPGSGAPKKEVKIALAEKISNLISDDTLINSLVDMTNDDKVKESDRITAIKLLMAYGHGTPVQTQVNIEGPKETPIIDLPEDV